jgi:hypothetical protein
MNQRESEHPQEHCLISGLSQPTGQSHASLGVIALGLMEA